MDLPLRSALRPTVWSGQTSTQPWNSASNTCSIGSVHSTQVLLLKEDAWRCSPWLNTSTIRETKRLDTSQQQFILNSRTETSACSTLKTLCFRLSQVKRWGIKAANLFIPSSSMNVLITRRASLSPWQERGVWWSLRSGCRQSRSNNKLTNRDLHQKKKKRTEKHPIWTVFDSVSPRDTGDTDWCDYEINF